MPLSPFAQTSDGSNPGVTAFWASMTALTTLVNTMEAAVQDLTTRVTIIERRFSQGPPDATHPITPPIGKI